MKKTRLLPGEDETLDSFYHGRIRVIQKKEGYRFSVDAPLLADFIRTKASDDLLELGAGCGIISLLLSLKPFRRITCLEIQPSLADLARRNIRLNGLEEKIAVIRGDWRTFRPRNKFTVVFSNPPYIRRASGFLSPSEEKSIAKHELKGDIFDIMHQASRLLRRKGRACFIYPAKRKDDFIRAGVRSGLKVRAWRLVYPRTGDSPRWILAEWGFTSPRRESLPPLVLFDEKGEYTDEVKGIFAGESRGANF